MSRDRAAARQRWHSRFSHDLIVLAGALAAMAVVAASFAIGPAISAARGDGTPGWFTNASQQCFRRSGCSWVGTFVSKSGHQVVPAVDYDGTLPPSTSPAARIPAILLMVLVGGAVALVLWISPLGSGPARARQAA